VCYKSKINVHKNTKKEMNLLIWVGLERPFRPLEWEGEKHQTLMCVAKWWEAKGAPACILFVIWSKNLKLSEDKGQSRGRGFFRHFEE
jgi:hypothetical protein